MFLAEFDSFDEIFIDANIWSYFVLRNPSFQRDCLLVTDALHAATCQAHNIKHIATNDADFDFLNVWKPQSTTAVS